MNKREKFLKEIAEVINRNSLEAHFNDTPDYILAKVAVEAMENFAEASARRDNWHGFKEADKPGEVVRNEDCDNCPVRGICPEHKKPEAFDVPKEVRAVAEFFGKMFPGSKVEIHRGTSCRKGTHGINAGQRTNERTEKEGATMKDNCKNPCMMFANPNICFIWDERLGIWRHTTADRIISGLMGNYQSAKA